MTLAAIIQARMGSERLPGKVLLPLGGKPVIAHVIDRVRAAGCFADVIVATTVRVVDDPLAEAAAALGAIVVRGDEADVLGRFMLALERTSADALARITADCPLIDPATLAAMAACFAAEGCDVLTNARVRSFPRGLDAEFVRRQALAIAASEALAPHQREHVTPFLYEHPDRFRIVDHVAELDLSAWRWTLDTAEDYALIGKIVGAFPDGTMPALAQLVTVVAAHPDWPTINAHIEQKKV